MLMKVGYRIPVPMKSAPPTRLGPLGVVKPPVDLDATLPITGQTTRLRPEPEVLPAVVPVLSVQPLVENAVRHGVESRPEGGTVAIEGRSLGADVERVAA